MAKYSKREETVPSVDEYDVFVANLETWLRDAPRTFVLIKGSEVYGHFPSRADALLKAAELFGSKSFFVRQVCPITKDRIANVRSKL